MKILLTKIKTKILYVYYYIIYIYIANWTNNISNKWKWMEIKYGKWKRNQAMYSVNKCDKWKFTLKIITWDEIKSHNIACELRKGSKNEWTKPNNLYMYLYKSIEIFSKLLGWTYMTLWSNFANHLTKSYAFKRFVWRE